MFDRLAITWQISDVSGWGVFGLNLVTELLARAGPRPLLLIAPDVRAQSPLMRRVLDPLVREQRDLAALTAARPGEIATLAGTAVLHHLGNGLALSEVSRSFQGARNVGVVFFESTRFADQPLTRARAFDRIVAGSNWNHDVLRARGLDNVVTVLQGVDIDLFRPAAKRLFLDRFVVFSGGKLEYRKGQDIVLAAFRAFRQRHPDALLVTLWHNPWPASARSVERSPHVEGSPSVGDDGGLRIAEWLVANGLPPESFVDLGLVPNAELPQILRHVDAAVFASRCEGGTNLVAMECMAAALPVILSCNTGHRDLIAEQRCFALREQQPIAGPDGGTEGWGESSVDELVAALERIHADRAGARARGAAAAAFMAGLSWRNQVGRLLAAIG